LVRRLVFAYIMAKMETGKDAEVISKIKEIKNIKESHVTYGVYDLLIKTNFEKIEDLDDFVFNVIRQIPGVKETVTIIVSKTIV